MHLEFTFESMKEVGSALIYIHHLSSHKSMWLKVVQEMGRKIQIEQFEIKDECGIYYFHPLFHPLNMKL